jgi:hypothetical protein
MSKIGNKSRRNALLTVTLAALVLAPAAHALGDTGGPNLPLVGTWQVTIDPGAPGGGDAFESTLSYSGSRQVTESTSMRPGSTEGLGSWERVDRTTYRMIFQKYNFNGGTYVGKAVIRETITVVDGDTYRGEAVATIVDPAGNTLATIPSHTVARRLTP